MNTVCRLCLGEKVQLLHVFELEVMHEWTAADAIRELLDMQVSSGDVYPKFICKECMGKLVDFKQFKNQCEVNKHSLDLKYSKNIEVGTDKVVEHLDMSNEEDSLDLFLEDSSNDLLPLEVVGSADNVSHPIKCGFEAELRNVETNPKSIPHSTSSQIMKLNKENPEVKIPFENIIYSDHGMNEDVLDIKEESHSDESFEEDIPRDVVGMVLCGNENHSEIFLKEEDVEVPVEKDNLDLSEEANELISEIEDSLDDYNEDSSAEVIGSSDQDAIQKSDQLTTIDSNEINIHRSTSTEGMMSNEVIPASEAELEPRVNYNTRISKRKKKSSNIKDNVINAHSSFPENNRGAIHTSSICGMEDSIGNEENATESHSTSSSATTKPISHSEEEKLHSELCGMALRQKRNRKMDVMDQSNESTFICNECNKSYSDKINLSRHIMSIHSTERPFKCHECSKSFSHKGSLNGHLRVHSGERPFKCVMCCKTFSQKKTLNDHLRIHSGERPFKCEICSKTFSQKINLITHLRVHSGEKPFKCEICSKTFSQKSTRNDHLRIHSGERPFKCEICSKTFSQKINLITHLRVHSGEKPFKCEICSKTFSQKSTRNDHLRIHSGDRPFKCEICSKTFSKKCQLNVHLRVHSGERPFKCELCSKTFSQKINLITHLRVHSGEKPFKCEICSKTFSRQGTLDIHLSVHSGERPVKCEICSKTFSWKSKLITHLKVHSGERPFKCEICSKTFSWKSKLITHLRVHS